MVWYPRHKPKFKENSSGYHMYVFICSLLRQEHIFVRELKWDTVCNLNQHCRQSSKCRKVYFLKVCQKNIQTGLTLYVCIYLQSLEIRVYLQWRVEKRYRPSFTPTLETIREVPVSLLSLGYHRYVFICSLLRQENIFVGELKWDIIHNLLLIE